MPIPGHTFTDGETVTHEELNAAVADMQFTAGELDAAALTNGTVSREKLADGAVNAAKVAVNSLTPDRLERAPEDVNNNRGGALLVSNALGDFVAQHPSGDVAVSASGALTIGDAAVTTARLATSAVTSPKIAAGAVRSYHLRTLVTDISGAFNDYAVEIPNITELDPVEHAGLFITLMAGLQNTGAVRLQVNGGTFYPVRRPDGGEVAAGEIASGQCLSLVFTGGHWAVMSPLTVVARTTVFNGDTTTTGILVPATGVSKIRIRLWGRGGYGVMRWPANGLSTPVTTEDGSYAPGYLTAGESTTVMTGGGGGGYAEWYGFLASAGITPGSLLAVEFSSTATTLINQSDSNNVLLRVTAGGAAALTVPGLGGDIGNAGNGGGGSLTTAAGVKTFVRGGDGTHKPAGSGLVEVYFGGLGPHGHGNGGSFWYPDGAASVVSVVPAGSGYCVIETEAA